MTDPDLQARIEGLAKGPANELDNEAVMSCQASDERAFREVFGRLLDYVRTHGRLVPDDELFGSDIILPPPDVSLAEAQREFQGDGLIPG